jgi:hypothetical protein
MIYFIQAKECDMNMHAKIQDLTLHIFVKIISLRFALLEIYVMHY